MALLRCDESECESRWVRPGLPAVCACFNEKPPLGPDGKCSKLWPSKENKRLAEVNFFGVYDFVWIDQNGEKFFVSDGISQGRQWGTFRRKKKGKRRAGEICVGSLQRVCSPALPMVNTRSEAQRMLNAWAIKKGLKLLCVFGKRTGCLLESGLCCKFCVDDLCLSRCMQYLPCTWEGD